MNDEDDACDKDDIEEEFKTMTIMTLNKLLRFLWLIGKSMTGLLFGIMNNVI